MSADTGSTKSIGTRIEPYLPSSVRWFLKPEVQQLTEDVCRWALPRFATMYVTYLWLSQPLPALAGFVSGIVLRLGFSSISARLHQAMLKIVERWKQQIPSLRGTFAVAVVVTAVMHFVPHYHATSAFSTAVCTGVLVCTVGAQLVKAIIN